MTRAQQVALDFFVEHIHERTDVLEKPRPEARYIVAGIKRWTQLHGIYREWCKARKVKPLVVIEYSYFMRLLGEWYPDLVLEDTNDLPACGICTKLNTYLIQEGVTVNEQRIVMFVRIRHKQLAHHEWLAYYALTSLARSPPGDYALIAVDASPAKALPHLSANVDCPQLQVHWITVVVITPWVRKRLLYVHFPQLWAKSDERQVNNAPTGCDLWISAFLDVLRHDILANNEQEQRPLNLLLHSDNTVRILCS